MSPDLILPDVTPEEYEKAGSKFATEGNHIAECGMPEWDTPGVSIKFPFTIVGEKDPDNGKENKISCGIKKEGLWKFKEMMTAIGVEMKVKDGKPSFDPMSCVGKQFIVVWTTEVDSRPPAEGGKGGTYTKPTSALPLGTITEKLI